MSILSLYGQDPLGRLPAPLLRVTWTKAVGKQGGAAADGPYEHILVLVL